MHLKPLTLAAIRRAAQCLVAARTGHGWDVRGQYQFDSPHDYLALALGAGSGENQKSTKQHDFQSFFMNSIGFHIASIYGNDIHSYDAFLPGSGPGKDGNNAGAGFANTGFVQLSGRIAPFSFVPDSTIEGIFTYLRATRSQLMGEGVLFGNLDGFTAATGVTETSHDIGWEADINVVHPLTDSMQTYLRTGWFVPVPSSGLHVESPSNCKAVLISLFDGRQESDIFS